MNYLDEGVSIAIVVGLVQVIKMYVPVKFAPAIAVVLGVAVSLVASGLSLDSGLKGIVIGLMSSGLYDQKSIIK